MSKYVLSLDEGTTSARALLFDKLGNVVALSKHEITQYYPRPGWVEHDPEEIWQALMRAVKEVLQQAHARPEDVAAIGVTNQRETVVVWGKDGKPLHRAIVWQCKRTADLAERLRREYGEVIKEKTGLIPDSYFSATKIMWLLENVPGLREKAEKGEVKIGTIDSYIIYRLTGKHVTDYSNASRTMLFNIRKLEWDRELLELLRIPEAALPEVRNSSEVYGYAKIDGKEIPVSGDAGDQQAALFGQACFKEGMIKSTYGTGNFILMNTGSTIHTSKNLLGTIAWGIDGRITYALEGSVFITGAAIQWLRDGLKIISSASETEGLATSLSSNEGVYFVPAFVGLGTPYWDQYARGLIIGITRSTKREHLARAVLEAIAYLTTDVVKEMDVFTQVRELRVDGGASENNFLMQFQANILGKRVVRPVVRETTAMGAAFLAGIAVGFWEGLEEVSEVWKAEKVFTPRMKEEERQKLYSAWKEAVRRAIGWAKVVGEE